MRFDLLARLLYSRMQYSASRVRMIKSPSTATGDARQPAERVFTANTSPDGDTTCDFPFSSRQYRFPFAKIGELLKSPPSLFCQTSSPLVLLIADNTPLSSSVYTLSATRSGDGLAPIDLDASHCRWLSVTSPLPSGRIANSLPLLKPVLVKTVLPSKRGRKDAECSS